MLFFREKGILSELSHFNAEHKTLTGAQKKIYNRTKQDTGVGSTTDLKYKSIIKKRWLKTGQI